MHHLYFVLCTLFFEVVLETSGLSSKYKDQSTKIKIRSQPRWANVRKHSAVEPRPNAQSLLRARKSNRRAFSTRRPATSPCRSDTVSCNPATREKRECRYTSAARAC